MCSPTLPDPPGITFFLTLETAVWQALVDGDAGADHAMLTADFLGVYPSGFAGRDDHAGQLADGPVMRMFQLDQARLVVITPADVLLCYRATFARIKAPREVMFVSSLWQYDKGQWRNRFSQDTPADPIPGH